MLRDYILIKENEIIEIHINKIITFKKRNEIIDERVLKALEIHDFLVEYAKEHPEYNVGGCVVLEKI